MDCVDVGAVSLASITQRIERTHGWILKVTEDLDHEGLAVAAVPTAPPIGWHLWHIARWADRLQASFPNVPFAADFRWEPRRQIWFAEGLARRWGLKADVLGILETGAGMDDAEAGKLAVTVERESLLQYARQTFCAVDAIVEKITPTACAEDRNSIMEYVIDFAGREVAEAGGAAATVVSDLGFHLSHASRHLGSVEALRGLLNMHGTATA